MCLLVWAYSKEFYYLIKRLTTSMLQLLYPPVHATIKLRQIRTTAEEYGGQVFIRKILQNTPFIKHARIQREGGAGDSPPPLKSQKYSVTGPDPLKITKVPSQHSMLSHHRHTSETPFKWHFADGPIMAAYSGIGIPPPPPPQKKKKSNLGPLALTKPFGSAHVKHTRIL